MSVFLFYFVAIFSDCFDEQHVENETDDHHDRVDGEEFIAYGAAVRFER